MIVTACIPSMALGGFLESQGCQAVLRGRRGQAQVENLCYRGKAKQGKEAQVENLCYWERRSEGLPVPREPALLAERSQDGEARAASRERRAGCP
jgi:hypothetical protein